MSKYLLVLVFLLGCENPANQGWAGYPCRPDYTCNPGLQCQITNHFSRCIPIGVPQ